MRNRALTRLTTIDRIWRPYAFDRVTVCGRMPNETTSRPLFSIIGPCYSEYASGPSLFDIVAVAGEYFGEGWYGIEKTYRPLGFRYEAPEPARA